MFCVTVRPGRSCALQLRWFVFGGIIHVILNFLPAFLLNSETVEVVGHLAIVFCWRGAILPLYLAVGIAILRYRLYDIDLIIRKTLQYGVLSGFAGAGLFWHGGASAKYVQFGQRPTIAHCHCHFYPGHRRPVFALAPPYQDVIDRRLLAQKYDAQQVLAQLPGGPG